MPAISVHINDETIPGVSYFALQGDSPPDVHGCPQSGAPRPFVAKFHREIEAPPGVAGFEWGTGGDGSVVGLKVEVELQNAGNRTTHTITLEDTYLASLETHNDGEKTREQWILHAGNVVFDAGGTPANYAPELNLVPSAGI